MSALNSPDGSTGLGDGPVEEWLGRLSELIHSVDAWATELGWSTRRIEKKMKDSVAGTYRAPALLMQEGTIRTILEPIARSAPGVGGVVDLYLLPAYDDIATLCYYPDGWKIHDPFPGGPPVSAVEEIEPKPLSREVLKAVLEGMRDDAS